MTPRLGFGSNHQDGSASGVLLFRFDNQSMPERARRCNPNVSLILISGGDRFPVARQLLPTHARAAAERRACHYRTGVNPTPRGRA
jgi:hypothetical protein